MKDLTIYRWRESCNAKDMGGAMDDCSGTVCVHFVLRAIPGNVSEDTNEDQVYWLCYAHWQSFIKTMLEGEQIKATLPIRSDA